MDWNVLNNTKRDVWLISQHSKKHRLSLCASANMEMKLWSQDLFVSVSGVQYNLKIRLLRMLTMFYILFNQSVLYGQQRIKQ